MTEPVHKLPLLDLFYRLQKEPEFVLGIDDYRLMLKALRAGYGFPDLEALRRLCTALWVRSHDENVLYVFNRHFEAVMRAGFLTPSELKQIEQETEPVDPSSPPAEDAARLTPGADLPPPGDGQQPESSPIIDEQIARMQTRGEVTDSAREIAELVTSQADDDFGVDDGDEIGGLLRKHRDYFPVTQRQMKQTWRYLRRMRRSGPAIELNLDATIRQIARNGFFLDVVMQPRRTNHAQLLLLLDQNGSMTPFHLLTDRIRETADGAGRLGRTGAYYFYNCPQLIEGPFADEMYDDDYWLFRQPTNVDAIQLRAALDEFDIANTAVMIVSDAGAARGTNNDSRVEHTRLFLEFLTSQMKVSNLVWLNPLPLERWAGNSAEQIAQQVRMIPLSRGGFEQAVSVLRGLGHRTGSALSQVRAESSQI